MDLIFEEEKKNLLRIENAINDAIDEHKKSIDNYKDQLDGFFPIDYEDVDKKRIWTGLLNEEKEKIANLEKFIPSPYFGRLDFAEEDKEDDEPKAYYIGKEGLTIDRNDIVVDWRAPVGECFYAQNQTEFNIKGIIYTLVLRRGFTIENAKLVKYDTQYDKYSAELKLEGDLIDPFLLTVLRDKRRQFKLTDIIRSIQANQNKIIRRPEKENFIVQGCAGSGKTMILLHRLSYLRFNNRHMSLANTKIITPNDDFSKHINELSEELDIGSITRLTVEEYYADLIARYSREKVIVSNLISENTLPAGLLRDIYSIEFILHVQLLYHDYWDNTLNDIDEPIIRRLFEENNITYPKVSTHSSLSADALLNGIRTIKEKYHELELKNEETRAGIIQLDKDYHNAETFYSSLRAEQKSILEQLGNEARSGLDEVEAELSKLTTDIQPARDKLQELIELDGGATDSLHRVEERLELLQNNYDLYTDYDRYQQTEDEIGKEISELNLENIEEIKKMETQLANTPNYNFVRKNGLRRRIQEQKTLFSEAAKEYINTTIFQIRTECVELKKKASNNYDEIQRLSNDVEVADKRIEQLKRDRGYLNSIITFSENNDDKGIILDQDFSYSGSIIKHLGQYERNAASIDKQAKSMKVIRERIEKLHSSIRPINTDETNALETAEQKAELLTPTLLFRQVMQKELTRLYEKHGIALDKENCRHKLFARLLFCSLYYDRFFTPDTHLSIDEAQDISVAEYTLLRNILGNSCVFNLYGDVNQSLVPENSITDWAELKDIIGGEVFELNEDYRNTQQITEYCNQEFMASFLPIGIKGETVIETEDELYAIEWLAKQKDKETQCRIALVIRNLNDHIRTSIRSYFAENDISWYKADDKRLSVLTIENAKGLEFEAVAVMTRDMEINERYIAYTRALDSLCIVK